MSSREEDKNGFLRVNMNPITKEGVFPYLGSEIGLKGNDANRVVYVYRPIDEIEKALELFKNIPIIDDHEMLGNEATPAEKKGIHGWVGESLELDPPYLRANLNIITDALKRKIESGKVGLSPGYRNDYEYKNGTFNGQRYEAIQRNIVPNHLALVDEGRTGKDVAVLDHCTIDINNTEINLMTLEELIEAIKALNEEEKAKLKGLFVSEETIDKKDEETTDEEKETEDEATETDLEQASDKIDDVIDKAEGAQDKIEEAVESGDPADIADAVEAVEEVTEVAEEAEEKVTMDQMRKEIIKEINKRDTLARKAQKVVGTFNYQTMDSAQAVAKYALGKLGIKAEAGTEAIVLDAYIQGRSTAKKIETMDSKKTSIKDSVQSKLKSGVK